MDSGAQSRELLSWRLIAALVGRLAQPVDSVDETHPGNGLYDCLVVAVGHERPLVVNRLGSVTVSAYGPRLFGVDDLEQNLTLDDAVRRVTDAVQSEDAPVPEGNLAFAGTLSAAVRLLETAVQSAPGLWELRNGFFDSSGEESEVRSSWFETVLGRVAPSTREEARRTWFLVSGGQPLLALDLAAATATRADGVTAPLQDAASLLAPVDADLTGSPGELAAARRHAFASDADRLAEQLGVPALPLDVGRRTSATVRVLGDDERCLLAVAPGETQADVDRALAWASRTRATAT